MPVDPSSARAPDLARAVAALRRGGLVAFPTETVYGLGADATLPGALRRLYAVKGRPPAHPVIVHLGGADQLTGWARDVPDAARALTDACWPGPLTVIVRRSARVPDEVTGGADTVGLRVPDQPLALALLHQFGDGIAAPSANRFGRVSPTTAQAVVDDLGTDVDVVLDGGPCRVGVESTIVDCTGAQPAVLRPGGVTAARLREILGTDVPVVSGSTVAAPGTLPSHYAPRASVVLATREDAGARATAALDDGRHVAVLCESPSPDLPPAVVWLDAGCDADDYARNLYARLREADARKVDLLLAIPPVSTGLGQAVADRLRRAAGARQHVEAR
ncbi:MAG TPA: L-threonylcarbamoyladenylate synthase [Acidimicrobiia bacterium]